MGFSGLQVDHAVINGSLVVLARGEIDLQSVGSLERALAMAPPPVDVAVDLAEVAFIDSAGLGVLLRHWQRLADNGGTLHIRNPSPVVRRVLDITGLGPLVD